MNLVKIFVDEANVPEDKEIIRLVLRDGEAPRRAAQSVARRLAEEYERTGRLNVTVERYVEWRAPSLEKFASDIKSNYARLDEMLTKENVGRTVVWMGSAPSGATFENAVKWDGTEKAARAIVKKTIRLSGAHAWRAVPVWADEHGGDIFSAEMRIG